MNSFGNGLLSTTTAIYFTRFVDIANHQLALTFSAAAVLSMLISVPIGNLTDRWRPRRWAMVAICSMGVLSALNIFVRSFHAFFILEMVTTVMQVSMRVNQQAYMGRLRQGAERVRMMSYQRAVMNLGLGVGSLAAGAALTVNSATAFRALFILDALTWFANAWIRHRLPDLEPLGAHGKRARTAALRDRTWLTLAALNGILEIHNTVLNLAVPLYIDQFTTCPKWVVAATFIVNTAMVAFFQVRFSRGADTPVAAGSVVWRSTGYLLIAFPIYGAAALFHAPAAATAVVLLGAFIHVLGELRKSAGAWGVQYSLVDPQMQGQYQAVWSMGRQVSDLAGPPLVTALCLGWGEPGWLALGVLMVAVGAAFPSLVRRGVRERASTVGQSR